MDLFIGVMWRLDRDISGLPSQRVNSIKVLILCVYLRKFYVLTLGTVIDIINLSGYLP
jgi:hypothetical protein